MSIINDALKKTQKQLTRQKEGGPSLPAQKRNTISYLIIVLVFITFAISLGLFIRLMALEPTLRQEAAALKANAPEPKAPAAVPSETFMQKAEEPPAPASQQPKLSLNGIIVMDGEYFALMGNEFLKEGDYYQGMEILSISEHAVELKDNDRVLTFKTR